jgi:O-antigen ligase
MYNAQWQLAEPQATDRFSAPFAPRHVTPWAAQETPIFQQVSSWMLFWPLLTLIARQVVYFSGPGRTAEAYQNGAAMGDAGGSHYYVYVNLLFMLGFVVTGYRQVWQTTKKNPFILAILSLAVCSALWSAEPVVTLEMCVQVGLCTLFGCYLSSRFTTEHLMKLLIFMGLVAALLSILFAVALPSYGIFQGYAGGAWEGICKHKNALGISMAFLLTPAFFSTSYSRTTRTLYGGLILFLIYKSQSRGAWADTGGMMLFVAWLALLRKLRARELILIVVLTVTITTTTVALGLHFWPMIAASMGKDPSMTGRTQIYYEVWQSILKKPLLGYGFGGFWYAGSPEAQRIGLALSWPSIGYSESGLLEVALQIGFVGIGLLFAMIGKAVLQGIRIFQSNHYTPRIGWFLTILFLVALTNIDAGWFMTSDTLDWVLVVVSCVGLNEAIHDAQSTALQPTPAEA